MTEMLFEIAPSAPTVDRLVQIVEDVVTDSSIRPGTGEFGEAWHATVPASNRDRILAREKDRGAGVVSDGWLYCAPRHIASHEWGEHDDCWRHTRIRWEAA